MPGIRGRRGTGRTVAPRGFVIRGATATRPRRLAPRSDPPRPRARQGRPPGPRRRPATHYDVRDPRGAVKAVPEVRGRARREAREGVPKRARWVVRRVTWAEMAPMRVRLALPPGDRSCRFGPNPAASRATRPRLRFLPPRRARLRPPPPPAVRLTPLAPCPAHRRTPASRVVSQTLLPPRRAHPRPPASPATRLRLLPLRRARPRLLRARAVRPRTGLRRVPPTSLVTRCARPCVSVRLAPRKGPVHRVPGRSRSARAEHVGPGMP